MSKYVKKNSVGVDDRNHARLKERAAETGLSAFQALQEILDREFGAIKLNPVPVLKRRTRARATPGTVECMACAGLGRTDKRKTAVLYTSEREFQAMTGLIFGSPALLSGQTGLLSEKDNPPASD